MAKLNLTKMQESALGEITSASSLEELESIRVKYLGKKGVITRVLRSLGTLSVSERPIVGKQANDVKSLIESALAEARLVVAERVKKTKLEEEIIDITLPGREPELGRFHPLTQVMSEIELIFRNMGFRVVEGPEVETEYYNFEALNTPSDHPARDEQDSFYLKDGILLRTQTSPVQIHVMESERPPIAIIAPGRCFRRDASDASHSPMFHQVEGLMVDEGISFADLKGVLTVFTEQMFGAETRMRFRPDFFPFTEPSADVSITCVVCKGNGCRVCAQSGWLEILGAGMVDPEVFRMVDYDAEKYTGFAFGMGVERIAMLKYGIEDIRLFFENDLRFLNQF